MVADRTKQELDAKMKAIADKRTAGLNVEKRAWAGLHEVEEEVSTMMAEVDKDVQKAVSIRLRKNMVLPYLRWNVYSGG